jgi:hypothetical protein
MTSGAAEGFKISVIASAAKRSSDSEGLIDIRGSDFFPRAEGDEEV